MIPNVSPCLYCLDKICIDVQKLHVVITLMNISLLFRRDHVRFVLFIRIFAEMNIGRKISVRLRILHFLTNVPKNIFRVIDHP